MKVLKLLVLTAIVSMVAFACAPLNHYNDAKSELVRAQDKKVTDCSYLEYQGAVADLKAGEAALEKAKNGGDKKALYAEAKAKFLSSQEKSNLAIKNYEANKLKAEKAKLKLAEFKKELDALEKDASKYDEYNKLQMKYERALELAENCRGEEALALLDECKKGLYDLKSQIAADKAAAMKESMTKNETASTDTNSGSTCEYEVAKGDSLWKISDMKYANPLMWPMIYWANKAQIKDPDLIYPGQVFKIKKSFEESEKADAIKFSKTRGPWSLFDGK